MSANVQNSSQLTGPPVCSRCNKHIYDGTIFQIQRKFWHNACVQCVICRKQISGCCHIKNNELYCRNDFVRHFGTKCSGCNEIISPSEGVHVANSNLYHTACFACSMCSDQLHAGDYFYLKEDGKLLCSPDYQRLLEEDRRETDSESDESGSDDTDSCHQARFNDNQLRMLTETYSANQRPSRHERQRISQETGLKPRTVQIWFHNRRSKDKNLSKSRSAGSKCNENSRSGRNWAISDGSESCNTQTFTHQTTDYDNQMSLSEHQLYCPLDFLVPNEMPPNVDLSSADILNGEVISGKKYSNNLPLHHQMNNFLTDNSRHWLAV